MKKIILLLIIVLKIATIKAQQKDTVITKQDEYRYHQPQALLNKDEAFYIQQKGNVFIQGYMGLSLVATIFRQSPNISGDIINKYYIVGICWEYMLSKNIGLGFEFGYSYYEISLFNSIVQRTVYRPQFRFNVHLIENKQLDVYIFANLGTRFLYHYEPATNKSTPLSIPAFNQLYTFGIPIAGKVGFGLRYFPIKKVGFYTEIAAGTPFLLGGICYKLK